MVDGYPCQVLGSWQRCRPTNVITFTPVIQTIHSSIRLPISHFPRVPPTTTYSHVQDTIQITKDRNIKQQMYRKIYLQCNVSQVRLWFYNSVCKQSNNEFQNKHLLRTTGFLLRIEGFIYVLLSKLIHIIMVWQSLTMTRT